MNEKMNQMMETIKSLTERVKQLEAVDIPSPTRHATPPRAAWRPPGSDSPGQLVPSIHPDIHIPDLGTDRYQVLFRESNGRPDRYGCLVLRAILPARVYEDWVRNTNWDGTRGKWGLPENLRKFVLDAVGQRYPTITDQDLKDLKDRVNELFRKPRTVAYAFPLRVAYH